MAPRATPTAPRPAAPTAGSRIVRLLAVIGIGLVGAGAVVGGYWWVKIRPRLQRIENPMLGLGPRSLGDIELTTEASSLFDLSVQLPMEPTGIGAIPGVLVVGSRTDPWGFMRLSFSDERHARVESVPVIETRYVQKVGLDSVTWNGKNWVGITTGSWFGDASERVFTIHDPVTLQVIRRAPAPSFIGAIAWDGTHWWAGGRKNTADAQEETYLYQLDANFAVTGKYEMPGPGCQGLAWDGKLLYWADVFDDAIHVLQIQDGVPKKVHTEHSPVDYLAGLAWDGKNLWAVEYGGSTLKRVRNDLLVAWGGGSFPTSASEPTPTPGGPLESDQLAKLHADLRSEDSFASMSAESELSRLGQSIDFDRRRTMSKPPFGDEEPELVELTAEIRDGSIYASWDVWVGPLLLNFGPAKGESGVVSVPKFAKIEVSVSGGSLPKEVQVEREPLAGNNVEKDVLLASGLGPGDYTVSVFIHVQYTKPDGSSMILNDSAGSCFLKLR